LKYELTSTSRIEGFSDGVFAIVITIMILEFRLPEQALDHGLWLGILRPSAPKILSYLLSFLILTNIWIGHHALMHSARYATPALMWTNNNLLFWMSLVPFATMVLGEHPLDASAVSLYGASLAIVAASFSFLRWLVIRENNFHDQTYDIQLGGLKRAIASTLIYLAAIPAAFLSIYISLALFVTSPIMFFIWHMGLTKRLLATRPEPGKKRTLRR